MASRGRRGGALAHEDKPRREEQAEQQAPAPQSPVLPPPPPVDYGVFMQGLVQAMQTQAHTQAALQAQLEAQERADVWWASLLRTRFEDGAIEVAWDDSSDDLQQLEASWSLEEGFPDSNLLWRSTKNPEEWCFGGFLGPPKEIFINLFDPFEDLFRGK
ncbi:hypothetical protein Taro_030063 [Colocasia esculenta]|uniref:Uncharacterized protein n=1 Tax=Colocasia esculenta TaxID=4460 RepID=A0A843VZ35_COLES|nr:hypothetical protein [Colocasia esculenta]